MDLTTKDVLIGVAAIGLVVFLMWFPTIMGAFVTVYERLGKKLEEQREKRERSGSGDE